MRGWMLVGIGMVLASCGIGAAVDLSLPAVTVSTAELELLKDSPGDSAQAVAARIGARCTQQVRATIASRQERIQEQVIRDIASLPEAQRNQVRALQNQIEAIVRGAGRPVR